MQLPEEKVKILYLISNSLKNISRIDALSFTEEYVAQIANFILFYFFLQKEHNLKLGIKLWT